MNMEVLLQMNILARYENGDSIKKMYEEFTECGEEPTKIFLRDMKNSHKNYTDEDLIISTRTAKVGSNVNFINAILKTHELIKTEKNRKELADCLRNCANKLESIKGDITNE